MSPRCENLAVSITSERVRSWKLGSADPQAAQRLWLEYACCHRDVGQIPESETQLCLSAVSCEKQVNRNQHVGLCGILTAALPSYKEFIFLFSFSPFPGNHLCKASTESELFLQLRKCHQERRFNKAQEGRKLHKCMNTRALDELH